ncbi:MAG: hypothetical protein AB7P24_20775 [Nitrospira sp.]
MHYLFRIVLLIVAFGSMAGQMAWTEEPSQPQSLWRAVPAPPLSAQPLKPLKPWVIRDREIALNLPLLHQLKNMGARPLQKISVELFDNSHAELDIGDTVSRMNDTSIIHGTFKPPIHGDFTFAITGDLLIGTIQIGNRIYKTDHLGHGRLRLVELDPDKMPRD